jgi:predicted nucleotidyltransferase
MVAFDMEKAKAFVRNKEQKRQAALRQRLLQAQADFDAIAAMIIQRYHPRRIYQWGSLLHAEFFSEISDIDLAVEGIQSVQDLFDLLGDAMQLTRFPLDIVQLETIAPEFRWQIVNTGKVIYERI